MARALLEAVVPLVDPELGPAAYGYRHGCGVADALQRVARLRDEGLTWVVRADVHDCFPTLPREVAQRRLAALVPDEALIAVVGKLGGRPARDRRGSLLRGVPQGCPLSPLLSNLVLLDVDEALLRRGFPVVRYGDDMCICAESESDAWEALRVAAAAVEELGMELGADKTAIMSFDQGFAFLGEDCGPRYPPVLDQHHLTEPDERSLYVALPGSRVRVSAGRVVVETKDEVVALDVPQSDVARIVCFGSVGLSAGARTWALANDVDVVLASRSGNYLGTMLSHSQRYRPARLRAQMAVRDERALEISKAIIDAKITKQRVLLQRANRRTSQETVDDAIGQLGELRRMVPAATTPSEALGMEGAAAHFYFPALGSLMPAELSFRLRSKQPPMDVPNAVLSFLYTVLLGECVTALHAVGLDPSIGLLHVDQKDRPSLGLDLLEEFRPLVAEQVLLDLATHGALGAEHGREERGGVLLTKAGRQVALDAYERRMLTTTSALAGFTGTLRRHLYRQAQRLRSAIMDPDFTWTGLSWR